MKYPTPFIVAALVCCAAAAGPESTTCDSPCDCHDAYGEARWSVKSDASLPPTDASAIQAVTPSDMFSWPGPDAPITMQSERTGIENKWFALKGRVRLCPYYFVETDRVKLRGALATTTPADKKFLHSMSEAVLVPPKAQ
jgi:hypothetical protein